MAQRFHFNPATGRTGKCEAQRGCRFGQSEDQHGETREAARANYEKHMAGELFSNTSESARSESSESAKVPLSSPDLPKGIDPTPIDLSTLAIGEVPEGMHRVTVTTGSSLRDYEQHADSRLRSDLYIGGKHKVLEGTRSIRVSDGSKVWAVPVLTGSSRGTLFLPMRELIPVAVKYSSEALTYNREMEERNRASQAEAQADSARRQREAVQSRLQQERIKSTPYEELSTDDRAAADRMSAEAEEKRWSRRPEPIVYSGPNRDLKGSILQSGRKSFLDRIQGVADYDIADYNNRVEALAASDLPRSEQERLIRQERVGYIQSMNSLLDRRTELAQTARAPRKSFRSAIRGIFGRSSEDIELQNYALERIQRDRADARDFAEKLFSARPYAQIQSESRPRRY